MESVLGLNKRSWKTLGRNTAVIVGILFLMMVIMPTHHDRTPVSDVTYHPQDTDMGEGRAD